MRNGAGVEVDKRFLASPGRGQPGREIRAKSGFCQHTVRTVEGHIVVSVADPNFDSARSEIQTAFVLELVGCIAGREDSMQISGAIIKGSGSEASA